MTPAGPGGASAYFSTPEQTLDPALFAADGTLHPGVRTYVLDALYGFFRREGIQIGSWLHAWLAGSGISYQWKASRGNGDLDVLLGIDTAAFLTLNPGFAAGSRQLLADTLNEQMKTLLWPATAHAGLGGSVYEVTYYWNPEVSADIRVIHPYAAWDLDSSRWDVPPDPAPRVEGFPPEWHERARIDAGRVLALYGQWSQDLHDVLLLAPDNPSRSRAAASLARVTAELRLIWDTLHAGRRSAFVGDGEGWGDFHNFLWQSAKAAGLTERLLEVIREDNQRRAAEETGLFGAPIIPAGTALRRAALLQSRWHDARMGL